MKNLIDDLYKDLTTSINVKDPRRIARYYLNHAEWKLHNIFYNLIENEDYKHILVIAPREHGKSEVFTRVMPIWTYLNNRNSRILIASKSKDQATKQLKIIKSDFEKNSKIMDDFGDLRDIPWQNDKIYLKRDPDISLKDPSFEAVGVRGAITGGHFDLVVVDDIIDDGNVKTKKERKNVETWFKKTVEPLLSPDGRICVVGTRKHYDDLYQNLLDNVAWYHVNCRYVEYGDHKRCGYRAIIQEPGKYEGILDDGGVVVGIDINKQSKYEILCPEFWTIEELLLKKLLMGTPFFNSEYQNDVTALEGLILDRDWLQFYKEPRELESIIFKTQIMAFDLAISGKDIKEGDYFAGVVLGMSNANNFYVIDTIREKLDFPQQVKRIINWYELHRPNIVVIETNAYQKALSQHLQDITTMPIVNKRQESDKFMRLMEITPYFESRRVYIRKDMDDFIEEYTDFPRGKHEDLLDAFHMAMSEAVGRTSNYELFGWRPSWIRKKDEEEWISSNFKYR